MRKNKKIKEKRYENNKRNENNDYIASPSSLQRAIVRWAEWYVCTHDKKIKACRFAVSLFLLIFII